MKKRKHDLFLLVQNINKHLYFSYFELEKRKVKQFLKRQIKRFFDYFTKFLYVSCVLFFYFFVLIELIQ